jgi:hypothetical protein
MNWDPNAYRYNEHLFYFGFQELSHNLIMRINPITSGPGVSALEK